MEKLQSAFYAPKYRKIDSFTEIQLLDAVLFNLNWLSVEQREMNTVCTMMSYLIEEIKKEIFEDVNHVRN